MEYQGERYSHSRWLRERLAQARQDQGRTALEVDADVTARLDEAREPTSQRIYSWEKFGAHPRIDQYAAWARALGFRLDCQLVPVESSARSVILTSDEAAAAAQLLDAAPEAKRRVILAMVQALLQ